MKRFHFNLGAVLTVRQSTENAALKGYAEALLVKQKAFARVDALHHELGTNWAQIRLAFAGQCTAEKIDQMHALLERRSRANFAAWPHLIIKFRSEE